MYPLSNIAESMKGAIDINFVNNFHDFGNAKDDHPQQKNSLRR